MIASATLQAAQAAALALLRFSRGEDSRKKLDEPYMVALEALQGELNIARSTLEKINTRPLGYSRSTIQQLEDSDAIAALYTLLREMEARLRLGSVDPNGYTLLPRPYSKEELQVVTTSLHTYVMNFVRLIDAETSGLNIADLQCQNNPVYPGEPLGNSRSQIRLLTLLPGSWKDPIQCTLRIVSLNSSENYEALSYTWGETRTPFVISINGASFSARENLYWALQYLRHESIQRLLWIDAVCINQADIAECNAQVQSMGAIYSNARKVLVWLGKANGLVEDAMDFARKEAQDTRPRRTSHKTNENWTRLEPLLDRDYWTRVWIVQEICLAKEALIICGYKSLSWRCITALREARKNTWPQYLTIGERHFMKSLLARIDQHRNLSSSQESSLWSLMEAFSHSQCQLIHDKVYGFLALASDCRNVSFPVDYSKTSHELYRDVMSFCYRQNGAASTPGLVALSSFMFQHLELTIAPDPTPNILESESPEFTIPACGAMFIEEFLDETRAESFDAADLVRFVNGATPFSHIGWWRDHIDPELKTTINISPNSSEATVNIPLPKANNNAVLSSRVRVFTARPVWQPAQGSIGLIIGIAPKGTKIGDIVCTFVESDVALILQSRMNSKSAQDRGKQSYTVSGRAQLMPNNGSTGFEYKFRRNKEIEVTVKSDCKELPDPQLQWPLTIDIGLMCLKALTQQKKMTMRQVFSMPPIEMVRWDSGSEPTETNHSFQHTLTNEDYQSISQNPHLQRHACGPGFAAVQKLGSLGYLGCTMQILYMIKPLRKIVLTTELDMDFKISIAFQDLLRNIHNSPTPVSPMPLVTAFGWSNQQINEPQDILDFWRIFTDKLSQQGLSEILDRMFLSRIIYGMHRHEEAQDISLHTCGTFENSLKDYSRHRNYAGYIRFTAVPPVLVTYNRFFRYDVTKDQMITHDDNFEYPPRFIFPDECLDANLRTERPEYQLHGVVVLEAVEPINRFLLYLRPLKEDKWLLFFGDTVTFASKKEVFDDNMIRKEGERRERTWLRTPVLLIYLRVDMLDELLG